MQADVGDRAPQRPHVVLGGGEGVFHCLRVPHVAGPCPDTVGAEPPGQVGLHGLQAFRAASGDRQAGALGEKRLDNGQADAAASAGHEHHLVSELKIHGSFSPYDG